MNLALTSGLRCYQDGGGLVTNPGSTEVTQLIQAARTGDSAARARLIQVAYDDLREIAAKRMRAERCNHTLTATALVHEVSIRLFDDASLPIADRNEFLAYASRAMRNLLVDHARNYSSQKRGGDLPKFSFDEEMFACDEQRQELLAVNEALEKLAQFDPRKAQVVEMRYFGGLSRLEVAAALAVSEGTVKRDWDLARAWLRRYLQSDDSLDTGSK